MDAHVLKAPHHGSHKFYHPWLDAINPQISVISSGEDRDHGALLNMCGNVMAPS
jgi:beta-lactamase superfamily II metal-dependent hydrolase